LVSKYNCLFGIIAAYLILLSDMKHVIKQREAPMVSPLRAKPAAFMQGLLVGASAGGLTMAICNLVYRTDRAGHLGELAPSGKWHHFRDPAGRRDRRLAGFRQPEAYYDFHRAHPWCPGWLGGVAGGCALLLDDRRHPDERFRRRGAVPQWLRRLCITVPSNSMGNRRLRERSPSHAPPAHTIQQ
jgi:hypothetical protein